MNIDDFIRKAVGVPWQSRKSDWSGMDCWGLVIMFYKHVLNIELPFIDGYQHVEAEMSSRYVDPELKTNRWIKQNKPSGDNTIFLAYHKGEPCHVGVVIDDNFVLHTNGNSKHGQVQYNKLEAVARQYQKLEFYKYDNLSQ